MGEALMNENQLYEHRLAALESDVKSLYGKAQSFAVTEAELNVKLDSLIESTDELKEKLSQIGNRPLQFWDKLVFAFIGAVGAGIGTALLSLFKGV
jgi:hypothetical protein